MNFKSTDRRDWQRVPRQLVHIEQFEDDTVVYLKALDVKRPLIVDSCGSKVKIMDTHYLWLFVCNTNKNFVVTVQCNQAYQPLQWYVDVVKKCYINDEGFPYFDDLYLDVIRSPSGVTDILDEEELAEALQERIISNDEFELAWQVAKDVDKQMKSNTFKPVLRTPIYIEQFRVFEESIF